MTERWIGVALAATSVGQLVVAELISSKTGEFAKQYFSNTLADDKKKKKKNELGLPDNAALRQRLTDEVYSTAELAADGSSALAAGVAAFAGLIATCIISVQAKDASAAWISGVAALAIVFFVVALIVQLLKTKLNRYVVGEPRRDQKKTKDDEPSWRQRSTHNVRAAIAGYFHRVRKLHTLTPYKTSVIVAGIVSAVIGILI
jgi:ABC-type multidrug transport system fused ATPase/permease subunit